MNETHVPTYTLTKLSDKGDYSLTVHEGHPIAIKKNHLTGIVWLVTQEFHRHDFWEICLVLKGSSLQRFPDKPPQEMREGSVYLLRPHDVHCITPIRTKMSEFPEATSYTHRDIYIPCDKMKRIVGALGDGLYEELLSLDAPLRATLPVSEVNRLESLLNSYAGKEEDFDLAHSVIVSHILCALMESRENSRAEYPAWMNELLANLNREDFMIQSVKEIIDSVGYNQSYVCRQFKRYTAKTLTDYIRYRKCSYSTSLLSDLNVPIAKIAHRLNFADQSAYTRFFKSYYGVTPSRWRKRLSAKEQPDLS